MMRMPLYGEMAFGAGCNANRGVVIVITLALASAPHYFNDGQRGANTEFVHMKSAIRMRKHALGCCASEKKK